MGVAMSRLPIDIRNARWVAGVDEVGRGCLAGPVFAAAVILPSSDIEGWGLRDSKRLSGAQRQRCGSRIRAGAVAFALGRAEIGEIDRLNSRLERLNSFILPGGSEAAAHLHLCRTICRRAERKVSALIANDVRINPAVLKYLNRLSDLLFVMARTANDEGRADVLWVPGKDRD